IGDISVLWLLVITLLLMVIVTEFMSNTAATATFVPIVVSVAIGFHVNPLLLAIPITIIASCAFVLPVSTPPNAIVYGSGELTIPDMLRAGILLDFIFVFLVLGMAFTLIIYAFNIDIGYIPDWISDRFICLDVFML